MAGRTILAAEEKRQRQAAAAEQQRRAEADEAARKYRLQQMQAYKEPDLEAAKRAEEQRLAALSDAEFKAARSEAIAATLRAEKHFAQTSTDREFVPKSTLRELDMWDNAHKNLRTRATALGVPLPSGDKAMMAADKDVRDALAHLQRAMEAARVAFATGAVELQDPGASSFPTFVATAASRAAVSTASVPHGDVVPLKLTGVIADTVHYLQLNGWEKAAATTASSLFLARLAATSVDVFERFLAALHGSTDQAKFTAAVWKLHSQPIWSLSQPPTYDARDLLLVCNTIVVPHIQRALFQATAHGTRAAVGVPVLSEISAYTGSDEYTSTAVFHDDHRFSLSSTQAAAIGNGIAHMQKQSGHTTGDAALLTGVNVLLRLAPNKDLEQSVPYLAVAPLALACIVSILLPPRPNAIGQSPNASYGPLEFVLPLVRPSPSSPNKTPLAYGADLWHMYSGVAGVNQEQVQSLCQTERWPHILMEIARRNVE